MIDESNKQISLKSYSARLDKNFTKDRVYLLGQIINNRFYTYNQGYDLIDTFQFEISDSEYVIGRSIDKEVSIFFESPIFNSYILQEESIKRNLNVMKSFDSKLTIINQKVKENKLYRVKIIKEEKDKRIVELYNDDEIFPGRIFKVPVNYNDIKFNLITTPIGKGKLILQSNDVKPEIEVNLVVLGSNKMVFAEINNPLEDKNLRMEFRFNNSLEKFLIAGNIYGMMKSYDFIGKKFYNVTIDKVMLGWYLLVERLEEGVFTVVLTGKNDNNQHVVEFGPYKGVMVKKQQVSKKMIGKIFDIKEDSTFSFIRTVFD
ncbi:hypothetical protein A0H76_2735 [Hepatospora eriocheir]|uniref:Uncharacterized protein n=1 Tax=Hepatospora eriocheir TaxID=1081669 RepID=A0A1X0QJF0_9MICR|nr:hypothetical protein A0H76_2735 [Hepatospora eriocheir]